MSTESVSCQGRASATDSHRGTEHSQLPESLRVGPDKKRRGKTGCLCCRARRKKCDERRPICVGCERNFLVCSWPPLPTAPRRRRRVITSPTRNATRNDEAHSESPGHGSVTPNHEVGTSNRIVSRPPIRLAPPLRNTSILLKQPMQQQLYQHYLRKTAHSISSFHDHTNPFITYILPIAESDDMVLQAILALSGAQLSNQTSTSRDMKVIASTHYTLALRGLKFGITEYTNGQEVVIPLLSATLLMCLVEAVQGTCNENVFRHLKGARSLLLEWIETPEARRESTLRAFLVEIYLYTATLTSTPFGKEIQNLILQDSHLLFPLLTTGNGTGALLGCAHGLFELIPQIYARSKVSSNATTMMVEYYSPTYLDFQLLLTRIVEWLPPENTLSAFAACGKIYQQALLVFLYTSVGTCYIDLWSLQSLKDQCLDTVQSLLESLPIHAPISGTLTWPLAMVGSCARTPEHRDMIRRRLNSLYEQLNISCFAQLLYVLEILWESGVENSDIFHLEQLMRELDILVIVS